MGQNEVQPGEGGTVRTVFGEYAPELDISAWDPPRRFGYRSGQAPDGRFIAYEFLIEARAGGSTVLRAVTSGFIPGDDWAEEYEAMTLGSERYFRTLAEYLTHFAGRFVAPVTASGPAGDRVRLTADETGPATGVVYFANVSTIGVRAPDAFYRFLRGFGKPVIASHQLSAPGANPGHVARAWQSCLGQALADALLRQPVDQQAEHHDEPGSHDSLDLLDKHRRGQEERIFEKGKAAFHPALRFVEAQHLFGALACGGHIRRHNEFGFALSFCLDG